jgi:hypothetical protein
MPIFYLYSKRRKAERGQQPDVYTYDEIPSGLRVQIIHIWRDAIGNPLVDGEQNIRAAYQEIVEVLRRESGLRPDKKQPCPARQPICIC